MRVIRRETVHQMSSVWPDKLEVVDRCLEQWQQSAVGRCCDTSCSCMTVMSAERQGFVASHPNLPLPHGPKVSLMIIVLFLKPRRDKGVNRMG